MTAGDGHSPLMPEPQEDYVLPFQIETAGARGRLIRADKAVDTILLQHEYPEAVSALLAEAITLTALLGASLKIDGRLILQTSSDGPVNTLVAQYKSSGDVRGYASFDEKSVAAQGNGQRLSAGLLGQGHLAMTIDPGAGMERYQGVVALEGETLAEAADLYFRQSEQIPTFIRIAVARAYTGGGNGQRGNWAWRAGGLLVQKLTGEGGTAVGPDKRAPETVLSGDDEDWTRARMLAATLEDHELLDPALPPDRLLYRLFHQEEVRAFPARPLQAQCSCSRQRVEELLVGFSQADLTAMTEHGRILVKCEFCNRRYEFDPAQFTGGGEEE